MAGDTAELSTFVLTLDAVRASIDLLHKQRIHPFFPAYLHLRQQAARQGTTTAIEPHWNELGEFLEIPGGPPDKPYFRPFWSTQRREAGQEWLNRNLAGSYAPSSIRTVPRRVIDINPDGSFQLRDEHWVLARRNLTNGDRVPVVALAAFFFRNFGFVSETRPDSDALAQEFRRTFGYDTAEEFTYLYGGGPPVDPARLFELYPPPASDAS